MSLHFVLLFTTSDIAVEESLHFVYYFHHCCTEEFVFLWLLPTLLYRRVCFFMTTFSIVVQKSLQCEVFTPSPQEQGGLIDFVFQFLSAKFIEHKV